MGSMANRDAVFVEVLLRLLDGVVAKWKMDAASAASAPASKASTMCWGDPQPEDAMTGVETVSQTAPVSGRSYPPSSRRRRWS